MTGKIRLCSFNRLRIKKILIYKIRLRMYRRKKDL